MDSCLPDWNTETGDEFPHNLQRKPFGLDNELVELLWQNGEVVLHSQNNRKQSYDHSRLKQVVIRHDQDQSLVENPNNLIEDVDTTSWIDCPIDESFEKEFCSNFLSEIPSFDAVESSKQPGKVEKVFKFGASDVNHVGSSSQRQDFAPPPPLPPPRFQTSDTSRQHQQRPDQMPHGGVPECSIRTIGSSHCASNQVDMSWGSSCGIGSKNISVGKDETYARKLNEGVEREAVEQARTSCSGGSGSSFWKANTQSNDSSGHKRKNRDVEECESPSDATEMESSPGNKASQKSGTARRSRVAEVHNLSERRRRDRINEKMKALQELIPHSNKSDKASMLDEAIEYMKSLQLQIQLMWMGRGMPPMMIPGMQHYMSRMGMGIGPPMLPAIQNLMRLSRLPLVDQAIAMPPTTNPTPAGQFNYQNQMQNSSFQQQYANFMGFPNTSQPTNMFNFGFHSPQQNEVATPRRNGNGHVV